MKKKKNAILKSQIEQYEQLLKEVTKDEEEMAQENELKALDREGGGDNHWDEEEEEKKGSCPSLTYKTNKTSTGNRSKKKLEILSIIIFDEK